MMVANYVPVIQAFKDAETALAFAEQAKDSTCTSGPTVTKDQCLSGAKGACMFMELEGKNLCLPCKFGGVPLPCAPIGSLYNGDKVKYCQMTCDHQQVITKTSACVDVTGDITTGQCFAKGLSALQQCMWTSYTGVDGKVKNICGPCMVVGIGKIPPYAPGNEGPEGFGSSVNGCASMCDNPTTDFGVPCDGGVPPAIAAVTNCHPTPPPPPPPMAPVPLDVLRIHTNKNAPNYFAVPVNPPYGVKQYTEASMVAGYAAGWPAPGMPLPPDAPMVIYGTAPFEGPTLPPQLKVMYGPPPPGIPGVPPPGYGMGTAPPPENVKAAAEQFLELGRSTRERKGFLRKVNQTSSA